MATLDDADGSATFQRLADDLRAYIDGQGPELEVLRGRTMPDPPWPGEQNPMLAYLIGRAMEIASNDGLETAVVWACVHGWFEGALDEHTRSLDDGLP